MVLKIYDMNKNPIGFLKDVTNLKIESDLTSADKKMTFSHLPNETTVGNEFYIQTETDEFVVKGIKQKDDGTQEVTAVMNVEDLDGKPVPVFYVSGQSLQYNAELALEGTGWTVEVEEPLASKVRTLNISKTNVYQLCKKIAAAYFCEVWFDTLNKVVHFVEEIGEDKGVYFMRALNLVALSISNDTTNFYTQIHPVGKDGVTIESVNGGVAYLQNFQYSSKVRTYYWEDANYTDPEILLEDSKKKLEEMSQPSVSYAATVADLAAQYEKYSILSYGLGDKVTLIDDVTGSRTKQRIKKMTEYPMEPEKNTCEISNAVLTFEEYQRRIKEAAEVVEDLTAGTGVALGSKIAIYYTEDGNGVTLDDWRTMVSHQLTKEGIISTVGNYYASYEDVTEIDKRLVENETIATQTADKFKWLVASGTSESDFTLTDRTAELVAEHINLLGLVTFSGLDGSTQGLIQDVADLAIASEETLKEWCYEGDRTYIDGGNIYAGTIKATQIDVEDLFAQDITATNLHITGDSTFDGVLNGATGSFSGDVTAETLTAYKKVMLSLNDGVRTVMESEGYADNFYVGIQNTTSGWRDWIDGAYISFSPGGTLDDGTSYHGMISLMSGGVYIQSNLEVTYGIFAHGGITTLGDIYEDGTALSDKYLAKTGGTLSGNLTISISGASESQINVSNGGHSGRLVSSAGYNFGLYDATYSKWLVKSDSSGAVSYAAGTFTGGIGVYHSDTTSSAVAVQNSLKKGVLLVSAAGQFGLYDQTKGKWLLYSDTSGNVSYAAGTFLGDVVLGDYALRTSVITKYGDATTGLKLVAGTSWKAISAINDNTTALGYSNVRYTTVYAVNSTISTSDENEKDIQPEGITEAHENMFMDFKPILYKWKQFDNESHIHDRIHCGLGAQSVLASARKYGLDEMSVALICRDDLPEPTVDGRLERYGLAYEELHGLEIHMIQKNVRNISAMLNHINQLEERVMYLERQLQARG